jgi:hypothetical protein
VRAFRAKVRRGEFTSPTNLMTNAMLGSEPRVLKTEHFPPSIIIPDDITILPWALSDGFYLVGFGRDKAWLLYRFSSNQESFECTVHEPNTVQRELALTYDYFEGHDSTNLRSIAY